MGYPGSNLEDYFPHELIDAAIEQIKKGELGDIQKLYERGLALHKILVTLEKP